MDDQTQLYLQATRFMDYGAVSVSDFARDATGASQTDTEAAVNLYYAVRDQIRYDPYSIALDRHLPRKWPPTDSAFAVRKIWPFLFSQRLYYRHIDKFENILKERVFKAIIPHEC